MHFIQRKLRIVISVLCFILISASAFADEKHKIPRLNLTGIGEVKSAPDMAMITTGVIVQGTTAQDAIAKNSQKMAVVIKTLKNAGLDKKDIQTSSFNVGPRYKHSKDGTPPTIIGYQVTNQVTIRVRDLKKLGNILDQIAQVGANRMSGIRFTHSNISELMDQARALAVKDALRKAKIYTEGTDTKLERILSISENSYSPRPISMAMERASKMASSPVPIAAGESTIRAQVHIVWEID